MSDHALRELERAAREDGDAGAWTRLARAQARAGLDGARAAVQALLRDPAAPVRELLVAGRTPAPRELRELPGLELHAGRPFAAAADLGGGRALVSAEAAELAVIDLFGARVVWSGSRGEDTLQPAPVVVGYRLVELALRDAALELRWTDAATGAVAGRLALEGLALADDLELLRTGLVSLDGARCAVIVEGDVGWWIVFCDLARRVSTSTVVLPAGWPQPLALPGALLVDAQARLHAWEADGRPRWTAPCAEELCLLAAGDGLVVLCAHEGRWEAGVLDAADGRRLATIPREWRAAVVAPGPLLVGAGEEQVEAWTPAGARVWTRALPCPRDQALSLHAAGDVVVAVRAERGLVRETTALDLATGEALWVRPAPDDETLVAPVGGLLLAAGPRSGRATPLRRLG